MNHTLIIQSTFRPLLELGSLPVHVEGSNLNPILSSQAAA